jgi:hypothetical protein
MLSQSRLKGDGGCFGGDGASTEPLGSTTGGFGLQNFWMHSIARNAARPASRQRKKLQVGRDGRAGPGGHRTG